MKRFFSILLILCFSSLIFAQNFYSSLSPNVNQSVVYVGSYDWGACIEKIVINTGRLISPQEIRAKDFEVNQILYPKNANTGIVKSELTIVEAFSSDFGGNKITTPSQFITLLTDVYPNSENSSPFVSIILGERFKDYYGYKITNKSIGITIQKVNGFVNEKVTKFETSNFDYTFPTSDEEKAAPKYREENITFPYAYYIPQNSKKVPLILWFHGMGESGKNIYQVLLGTKSTALADEKIQGYFKNGVAILAPQCPTGWLETTEKGPGGARLWAPVDKDAPMDKIKKPIKNLLENFFVFDDEPKKEKIPFAAVSYYTEPVKKLLFKFLAEHPEIDKKRIYVGGCSAGGYMTMNMILQNSELFAAAFPICEYYLDSKITNAQIKMLSEKPLWFTYALNDETVNPEKNSIATIKRLKEVGAKNLHVSEFRNVVDLTGKYLLNRAATKDDDEYGLPYEYDGHYSWIYVLNDDCKDNETKLFKWLNEQHME